MTIDSLQPRAHEWEMVNGFELALPDEKDDYDRGGDRDCMLEPVAVALEPLGLEDRLLCEISRAVEQAGEELRSLCPTGRLDCIDVRVQVSKHALRHLPEHPAPWQFFVLKQIASSESDTLDALEHPRCFIDLHVY